VFSAFLSLSLVSPLVGWELIFAAWFGLLERCIGGLRDLVNDTHQTQLTCEDRWDLLGEERGALKLAVSGRGIIGWQRACVATALIARGWSLFWILGLDCFCWILGYLMHG
jgi:hypothetical protein